MSCDKHAIKDNALVSVVQSQARVSHRSLQVIDFVFTEYTVLRIIAMYSYHILNSFSAVMYNDTSENGSN